MAESGVCRICLEADPPPIQSGCACRGDAGLAHIACLVQAAESQLAHRGDAVWVECQTCKHYFTGAMKAGLAAAKQSWVAENPNRCPCCASVPASQFVAEARRSVDSNLAQSLMDRGKYTEAESIHRKVLGERRQWLGAEHKHTLVSSGDLVNCLVLQHKFADAEVLSRELLGAAMRVHGPDDRFTITVLGTLGLILSYQGKHAYAEEIQRKTYEDQKRVLGAENPDTIATVGNLAMALLKQDKYAEAEALNREALAMHRRVLGPEHPGTLTHTNNVALSLMCQGKYAEAEAINRELLAVRKRVLGAEHPNTLKTAGNLACCLYEQSKYAEAQEIGQATLASCQRVLGSAHPHTVETATNLEKMRAACADAPTEAAPLAASALAGPVRPLPAGTRVLMQRLVAKPEHNGKRARVLSFDVRTGRYRVALDDGRQLLLKAECVARAGCAAAGCASEEAKNVCSRCEAVRYCSRECQRADWKAHKPACTAPARPS